MSLFADLIFCCVWYGAILTYLLWRRGYVSAWLTRNIDRVYTLAVIANAVVRVQEGRYGMATFLAVGAVFGVLGWNRPRDDDDDDRKRRKWGVIEKKENLSKGWSGMEPVGT